MPLKRTAVCLLVAVFGWALAWAIGCSVIYFRAPAIGWALMAAIGGLSAALLVSLIKPRRQFQRSLGVWSGWLAGGIVSSLVADYNLAAGWLTLGGIGGACTAILGARATHLRLAVAGAWIVGGLIAAWVVSATGGTAAPFIAHRLLGYVPARRIGLLSWAACWAVGGGLTGAIGGSVVIRALGGNDRRGLPIRDLSYPER